MNLVSKSEFEKRIVELGTQLKLIAYVGEYLETNSEDLIPANLGLSEGALEASTLKYNELLLERNRILKSSSKLNFEILSTNTTLNVEGYSKIIGSVNTKTIALKMLDKASIILIGIADDLELESYGSTSFKGKDFSAKNAAIKANNDSTIFINSTETINLYSNNDTEINIYSNPEIIIHEFYDKAIIRKKELN